LHLADRLMSPLSSPYGKIYYGLSKSS
jgi:hypothetical protein